MSECDREASIMRRPWPTRGCCDVAKKVAVTECCKKSNAVQSDSSWRKYEVAI